MEITEKVLRKIAHDYKKWSESDWDSDAEKGYGRELAMIAPDLAAEIIRLRGELAKKE